jgi:hypothetical protein
MPYSEDECRRKAAKAQAKAAEHENDAVARALWLQVAEMWLRLIPPKLGLEGHAPDSQARRYA